ncbi:MAG: NAD(P)-binding domain-containing protein, partial [Isosphaeraceae bacterium]
MPPIAPEGPMTTMDDRDRDHAPRRWGFIGAGKMATALIQGMIRSGAARPDSIVASDPIEAARTALAEGAGVQVVGTNIEVLQRSDVLV